MENTYTTFICDENNCIRTIIIEYEKGFPYSKGWTYIYKFKIQLDNEPKDVNAWVNRVNQDDKHFCSKKCMLKFIKDVVG
jgi:hypothetical protein